MEPKEIAILVVFVIFVVPVLGGLLLWTTKVTNDPGNPDNLEEGAEIIAEAAVPWWLGIFEWFAGLPGIIGAVLIIGLVIFLKWIGEIK
jgi:hypothetical protein